MIKEKSSLSKFMLMLTLLILLLSVLACEFTSDPRYPKKAKDTEDALIDSLSDAMELCEKTGGMWDHQRQCIYPKNLVDVSDSAIDFCKSTGGEFDPVELICVRPQANDGDPMTPPDAPEASVEESPQQEEGEIPVGTYIGTECHSEYGEEIVESEFFIKIAEDGTVTGLESCVTRNKTVLSTCTIQNEYGRMITFSGHFSGSNGYGQYENKSYASYDALDCLYHKDSYHTNESVCDEVIITVSGELMKITPTDKEDSNCGFYQLTLNTEGE